MSFERQMVHMNTSLLAFAVSLCKSRSKAEDLVQETYLKAWANRESYQENTNLRAWLFAILRNTYFTELRKYRREIEDVDGLFASKMVTLPNQFDRLRVIELSRAWLSLPIETQEALTLVSIEGMKYEDVGKILGIAVGTVKSQVHRGHVKLCELLDEELPKTKLNHAWNRMIESDFDQADDEDMPSILSAAEE